MINPGSLKRSEWHTWIFFDWESNYNRDNTLKNREFKREIVTRYLILNGLQLGVVVPLFEINHFAVIGPAEQELWQALLSRPMANGPFLSAKNSLCQ